MDMEDDKETRAEDSQKPQYLPASDKIVVSPSKEEVDTDESLIPPGFEPEVFDGQTGLGMKDIVPVRFDKDESG
jgi:hypothetical protein